MATAILTLAVLGAIMLAHVLSPAVESKLIDNFTNSLHGPGFAAVAVFALAVLRLYRRSPSNYLHAAVAAMAIGVMSEAVQIPGPRDASLIDLVMDALGIVAGLGIFARFDPQVQTRLGDASLLGLGAITILAMLLTVVPTVLYGYAAFSQYRAMPSVLSFEKTWERAVFSQSWNRRPELVAAQPGWPGADGTIARAVEVGRYGVLIRVRPYPDWSEYSTLSFVAASGDTNTQEIILTIRELPRPDGHGGPATQKLIRIAPQPTRYQISLGEIASSSKGGELNLSRVSSITMNASNPGSNTTLLLDDFRLE